MYERFSIFFHKTAIPFIKVIKHVRIFQFTSDDFVSREHCVRCMYISGGHHYNMLLFNLSMRTKVAADWLN